MSYTGSVILRWAMSTDADLAGYYIYQGSQPGIYNRSFLIGLTTSTGLPLWVVDQIPNNSPTYLALTAYDTSLNQSAFSAEITVNKRVPLLTLARQL